MQKNGDIEYDKLYVELFERRKNIQPKNSEAKEEEKILQEKLSTLESAEHQQLLEEFSELANNAKELKEHAMEARRQLSDVLEKRRRTETEIKSLIAKFSMEITEIDVEERARKNRRRKQLQNLLDQEEEQDQIEEERVRQQQA